MLRIFYSLSESQNSFFWFVFILYDFLSFLSMPDWEKQYEKRAQFWARILSYAPGVRAIFLSGSLPQGTAHQGSDIDFLFITRSGWLSRSRFCVFVILWIFRRLSRPERHAGQICPNHWLSANALEIEEKNAYAARLYAFNIPLYDAGGYWSAFVQKNQSWLAEYQEAFQYAPAKTAAQISAENSSSALGRWFERWLGELQFRRIKKSPEFQRASHRLIWNERELRFHPQPKAGRKH